MPCPSRGGHLTPSVRKRFLEGVTDRIDFPGGQAVETPHFHNSWGGFDLWSGN